MKRTKSTLLLLVILMATSIAAGRASDRTQVGDHFSYLPVIVRMEPLVEKIDKTLLIDGEKGRIYARAFVLPTSTILPVDGHWSKMPIGREK